MIGLVSRLFSSIGRALGCEMGDRVSLNRTVHVIFIMIYHEIFSTVIHIVPLLWYVQKFQFRAKVKATSTGKLLNSLSRINAVAELCSGKFNVA
jgi:hypothetical protein